VARKFIGLSAVDRASLPGGCPACCYWESTRVLPIECGAACADGLAEKWARDVASSWGECGRVAVEDGHVLGFVKYAPSALVPQAQFMPAGPPLPDSVLITCMRMSPEARRHGVGGVLLREAFRDLAMRGERSVQAYGTTRAGDIDDRPAIGMQFLLRNGFTVVRPHPEMPLLKVDLKTMVSWQGNLDSILDSLRIPMRVPRRAPAICSGEERE